MPIIRTRPEYVRVSQQILLHPPIRHRNDDNPVLITSSHFVVGLCLLANGLIKFRRIDDHRQAGRIAIAPREQNGNP
jgi:hypothetical protein